MLSILVYISYVDGQMIEVPFHYREIASELLDVAPDDIPQHHKIQSMMIVVLSNVMY